MEKRLTAAVNLHFLRTGHARNSKLTMPGDWLLFYLFIVEPKKEARFLRASLDLKNICQPSPICFFERRGKLFDFLHIPQCDDDE